MPVKRFIAGAVCPSCGVMDTVRLFVIGGQQHRDCVECGFSDVMPSDTKLQGPLPETRISREELVLDDNVDVVRIVGDSTSGIDESA